MWKGFQKPKRLASELESLTEKYGRFSAQPFERGWGTTVGNALRRALLSSIEGAAITAVKIEGVLHEFSSIPGVVEDATDIILNLKQVPIKLNTDLPKTIFVNVGEEVAIKEKMHQNAMVLEARNVAQSQSAVPWLEQEREQFKAKVVAMPKRDDVQTPPINEQLIVELYSK